MKHRFSEAFGIAAIVLSISLLTAGCGKTGLQADDAAMAGSATIESATEWVEVPTAESDPGTDSEKLAATPDVDGAVSLVSHPNETVLPAGLKRGGPFSDLVRLADSGLDESVLLSYIQTCHGIFGMGPEEIIFLKDIGVSSSVAKAMIDHDHLLTELNEGVAENRLPNVEQINFPVASGPGVDTLPGTIQQAVYEIPGASMEQDQVDLIDDSPSPSFVEIIGEERRANPDFYRELAPYGSWVDVEGSGRCWKPTVAAARPDWQPYCDRGHWVLTECGWYWRSDYSWGWAPFHYGRWLHHSTAGWCWRPDQIWGPAWVAWRSSRQYCGWAPLPPAARFIHGQGLFFRGVSATSTQTFGLGPTAFCFVPWNSFLSASLSSHQTPVTQATRLFGDSHPATSIVCQDNRIVNTHPGAWEHLTHGRTILPAAPLPQLANASSFHRGGRDASIQLAGMHEPSARATSGSFDAPEFRNEAGTTSLGFGNRDSGSSAREREAAIRRSAPRNSLIIVGSHSRASGEPVNSVGRNPVSIASHVHGGNSQASSAANLEPSAVALNDAAATPWWARPTPPVETHAHNIREPVTPWNASSSSRGHAEPAGGEPLQHHSTTAEAATHSHHQSLETHETAHAHAQAEPAVHSETHTAAATESHSSSHSSTESTKESHSSSTSSEHHGR